MHRKKYFVINFILEKFNREIISNVVQTLINILRYSTVYVSYKGPFRPLFSMVTPLHYLKNASHRVKLFVPRLNLVLIRDFTLEFKVEKIFRTGWHGQFGLFCTSLQGHVVHREHGVDNKSVTAFDHCVSQITKEKKVGP